MRQIYLDSNILIACYSVDSAEEPKRLMVASALEVFTKLADIQLCTSAWALTEAVNILTSAKNMPAGDVATMKLSC
jgi:hypothetical protein